MINPFRWHGVVETRDFLETVPVNSLATEVDSDFGILYYKPPVTDVLTAAKASYMGRVYLDWAVFPYVREANFQDESGEHLVEFQDLRYTYPSSRGTAPLSGYVLLGPKLTVLEEGMNSSRSAAVGALEHGGGR
jgi:inner membrane protein